MLDKYLLKIHKGKINITDVGGEMSKMYVRFTCDVHKYVLMLSLFAFE